VSKRRVVITGLGQVSPVGNDVATAWAPGKSASARLWSLDSAEPSPLEMVPENGGTSLLLPPVPVYAGIELIRKRG